MKPLPAHAYLKGDPFLPNRFIFGDAIDENGIEEYEYLFHTAAPAFICRIMRKTIDFDGAHVDGFASAILFDPDENVSYYACNDGLAFTDFIFYGEEPNVGTLQSICDAAIALYWQLDDIYTEQHGGYPMRPPRIIKPQQLDPNALKTQVDLLRQSAEHASEDVLHRSVLVAHIQHTLNTNDSRVLTEAQLALQHQPIPRETLLSAARDLISQPELAREDGTFQPYDLWAMPIIFTAPHSGDCWFIPGLTGLERVLRKVYGLGRASLLHVSPTLFTIDFLREYSCQSLVHVAESLDAGEAFVPEDPETMFQRYQDAAKTPQPRIVLAWIVFSTARGTLTPDRRPTPNAILDAAMPVVEQAFGEILFGEATLFAPEPLWESFATGTREFNLRRLFFIVTLLEKRIDLDQLRVDIQYLPEKTAFQLSFIHQNEMLLAPLLWLLTPDLAPDRDSTLESIYQALRNLGLKSGEFNQSLH